MGLLRSPEGVARLTREFAAGASEPARSEPTPTGAEDDADTLSRLLGKPRGQAPEPGRPDVSELVRRLAGSATSPAPNEPTALRASIQAAAARQLGAILSNPEFRRLEAVWRSLDNLIHGVELDEELQLAIANIHGVDPATALDALLQPAAHGDEPWSVILLDREFGPSAGDLTLLRRLGQAAAHAGVSCLANASPTLLGIADLGVDPPAPATDETLAEWQRFRLEPAAAHIGLVLPRVLLRAPYSVESDPIDAFPFEERGSDDTVRYLWGSPALACGLLLGRGFREVGWRGSPTGSLDLTDLPAHIREVDGERQLQPCAEVLMPEALATEILSRGLMPLMSHAQSNAARLPALPIGGRSGRTAGRPLELIDSRGRPAESSCPAPGGGHDEPLHRAPRLLAQLILAQFEELESGRLEGILQVLTAMGVAPVGVQPETIGVFRLLHGEDQPAARLEGAPGRDEKIREDPRSTPGCPRTRPHRRRCPSRPGRRSVRLR